MEEIIEKIQCVVVGDEEVDKVGLLISYTTGRYPKEYKPVMFANSAIRILVDEKTYDFGLYEAFCQEGYERVWPTSLTYSFPLFICHHLKTSK